MRENAIGVRISLTSGTVGRDFSAARGVGGRECEWMDREWFAGV
jgi:hypothetical protein